MAKKLNKVIARIEALEHALAGLLKGGRNPGKAKRKSKKAKSAKPSRRAKAKAGKARPAKAAPARAKSAKPRTRARKPRKAETVMAVPPTPLVTL